MRSVRAASHEHIFLERCADLLPEEEAGVSLGEEELAMSKNDVMGQVFRMTLPSQLLGKQPTVPGL